MSDEKDKTRFWGNVEKGQGKNDCWNWQGSTLRGYGKFYANGQIYIAHRFAWVLENGEIETGKEIHHRCLNRRCVNPGHLELLTHAENMAEAAKRGAWAGERNGRAKLTDEKVKRVGLLIKGVPVERIAKMLKVSKRTIYCILSGETWTHVTE